MGTGWRPDGDKQARNSCIYFIPDFQGNLVFMRKGGIREAQKNVFLQSKNVFTEFLCLSLTGDKGTQKNVFIQSKYLHAR